MKPGFLITIIAFVFFLANCGDNKSATTEKQQTSNSSSEKKGGSNSNSSAESDDIIGEWELVSYIVDTNDNLQIDEEERAKLEPVGSKNFMKLNRDGSGLFTVAKMEGRYEIKEEANGRKFMTWYDKADGPHKVGSIIKVTGDELHIKEPGGAGLFLWKRL